MVRIAPCPNPANSRGPTFCTTTRPGGGAVQLFADRFVLTRSVQKEHGAIDLATGAPVTILTSSAGGASDQIRWSVRCDRFFRLHHRCIARLVDYGLVGQATRFEAWQCGERWRGSR